MAPQNENRRGVGGIFSILAGILHQGDRRPADRAYLSLPESDERHLTGDCRLADAGIADPGVAFRVAKQIGRDPDLREIGGVGGSGHRRFFKRQKDIPRLAVRPVALGTCRERGRWDPSPLPCGADKTHALLGLNGATMVLRELSESEWQHSFVSVLKLAGSASCKPDTTRVLGDVKPIMVSEQPES